MQESWESDWQLPLIRRSGTRPLNLYDLLVAGSVITIMWCAFR
jgi:hypothetical protein